MVNSRVVSVGVILCTILALGIAMAMRPSQPLDRERFDKLLADGNFKDAYDGYRRLALNPKTPPARVGTDLSQAIICLQNLGRQDEIDAFREAVIAVHQRNWRLLQAAAESYLTLAEHFGSIVAGKFRTRTQQSREVRRGSTSETASEPCSS